MRTLIILMMLAAFLNVAFAQGQSQGKERLPVTWTKKAKGDFSFKDKWDYPEGVYKNGAGQLTCDGLCPLGTEQMKDASGNVLKDSLHAFYRLVDTSHLFYTLECAAACYEWAGSNYITVARLPDNTVICQTQQNAVTHWSLILKITGDHYIALVEINSIANPGKEQYYYCSGGNLTIEDLLWKQKIVKAAFDLTFINTENSHQPISWKGKIYAPIE